MKGRRRGFRVGRIFFELCFERCYKMNGEGRHG